MFQRLFKKAAQQEEKRINRQSVSNLKAANGETALKHLLTGELNTSNMERLAQGLESIGDFITHLQNTQEEVDMFVGLEESLVMKWDADKGLKVKVVNEMDQIEAMLK